MRVDLSYQNVIVIIKIFMMKKQIDVLLYILVVIALSFTSCKKNNDVNTTTPAASTCKLTEIITTGRGELTMADPSTFTMTEKTEYNDKNVQTGYSLQSNASYSAGKTSSTLITRDFQYDADGYLVKEIYQAGSKDKTGKTYTSVTTQNYEYNKGLLAKTTLSSSYNDNGTVTNETGTFLYEYTADGKIAKYTNTNSGSSATNFQLFEYSNGKLSKFSFTLSGTLVTPLIEINSQGLITKMVSPSFEYRYQYDAEGNNIRQETWRNGTKDITVFELDNKQNVSAKVIPLFKGQPDLSFYAGRENAYNFTHNMTTEKFLFADISGVEKSRGVNAITYQYNSNGLPSAGNRTSTDANGKIIEQVAMSYTYSGCAP